MADDTGISSAGGHGKNYVVVDNISPQKNARNNPQRAKVFCLNCFGLYVDDVYSDYDCTPRFGDLGVQ